MLQNITLSADKELIERARHRAEAGHTTLNSEFRKWLAVYSEEDKPGTNLLEIIKQLNYAQPGRKFSRDEMNER